MRPLDEVVSSARVTCIERDGPYGGAFKVKIMGEYFVVIASNEMDWDHVSVSHRKRTPTYQEMKQVRKLFFHDDEWVVEYHPPEEDYISVNDNVLHMWRPQKEAVPVPPKMMV